MRVVVIEAGDIGEALAARMNEGLADFPLNLLQRLNAVGREGGRDDRDAFLAGLRKLDDMLDRVGPQPLLAAEDRLEGGVDRALGPTHPFAQEPRGLLAL